MEDLQTVIRAGVIIQNVTSKQGSPTYLCKYCSQENIPDIQSHIQSDSHKKKVYWEIVYNPSPNKHQLSLLPEDVLKAKQNRAIQALDRSRFSYACKVCPGDTSYLGLKQLQDHLKKDNLKKVKNSGQMPSSPGNSASNTSPLKKILVTDSVPSAVSPEVRKVLQEKTVYMEERNGIMYFICHVCNDLSMTGEESVKGHIQGKQHKKNMKQEACGAVGLDLAASALTLDIQTLLQDQTVQMTKSNGIMNFICRICNDLSMTGEEPLKEHIQGKQHKKNMKQQASLAVGSEPTASALTPVIQTLLRDQTIQMTESNGIMSFTCLVCNNVGLTGEKPLMDHIQGRQHKNNALQKACSNMVPDTLASTLSSEVRSLIQDKKVEITNKDGIISSKCLVCKTQYMTGIDPIMSHIRGKQHKNKMTASLYVSDSLSQGYVSSIENMSISDPSKDLPTEKNKNMVVVLNYKDFPPHISTRQGADKDSKNLKEKFTNLGYHIAIHENLTAPATEEVLKKLQNDTIMESLILIILSHGSSRYCFYTREGATMDLDKIRKKFTNTSCPQLRGKPKIILSNFCRGQDIELQTDDSALIEVPHHMVSIHASVENIKVLRHPRNGTIFISSLCKVLKKDQDLQEMLNELYSTMKDEGGTTPMMETFPPSPTFTF